MRLHYPDESLELNETTRSSADGSFVRLSDGITHYELAGPPAAHTVVLVHGFSVPYFIFDPTFEFLTASGFRVLRYDLFGRGWSDRPNLPNNIDLFIRQLHDLLAALNIISPITLIGLSMGGPISAAFTVCYPDRVGRNVLIDPAGTRAIDLGIYRAGLLPLLGELVLGVFGSERIVKNIASDFFDPALVEQFQSRYRPQMRFAGFRRSILSTVRNHMLGDFSETYRLLGQITKPTLLLWGRQDATVPFEHSTALRQLLPRAEFHVIEGCGHIPHYEKPAEVNPILLHFLQDSFTAGDHR